MSEVADFLFKKDDHPRVKWYRWIIVVNKATDFIEKWIIRLRNVNHDSEESKTWFSPKRPRGI